jgi:CubicO group peptidase (beta-lactamase class C family)
MNELRNRRSQGILRGAARVLGCRCRDDTSRRATPVTRTGGPRCAPAGGSLEPMSRSLVLAAIALSLAACTPDASKPPPKVAVAPPEPPNPSPAVTQRFASVAPSLVFFDQDRRKKLEASFGAIDAMAEVEMRRQGLPSVAFGIVVDGELVHAGGFGFTDVDKKTRPDANTIYRIGSIGKSFTSLALLALRDDGTLGLDDPLSRWIPEAAGLVYPTRDQPPITLRQLVTHTSGLPGNGPFELGNEASEESILKSLSGLSLERPPGTAFHYSNLGFVLAGLAASHAAHLPLRELVSKRIFTPLGMESTAWDREALPEARIAIGYAPGPGGKLDVPAQWRVGATAGAGGIHSSVRDMGRYLALQLSAYPPRNTAEEGPIRRSTLREAHSTGLHARFAVGLRSAPKVGEALVQAEAESYGFGWVSSETCDFGRRVGHSGGMPGFTAGVEFLPEYGVGVVALANGPGDPELIAKRALTLLAKGGGLEKRSLPLSPALEAAATKLLAVYDAWDEAKYAAMLSAKRPPIPVEKDELASYKALHGTCKGFSPIEVASALEARLRMQCERGSFEMKLNISANDGGIEGFVGISRDVTVPAEAKKVIERVVGLVGTWDASVHAKHLAKSGKSLAETAAFFDGLRAEHASCKLSSATREGFDFTYDLACKRGVSLSLRLETDPKNPAIVTRYDFLSGGPGKCPVR